MRTGDEKARALASVFPGKKFGAGEMGREDQWLSAFGDSRWYVGKQYGGNTEILSMGLEKLYNDPIGFAIKDPQFFKFVVGVLRGTLL